MKATFGLSSVMPSVTTFAVEEHESAAGLALECLVPEVGAAHEFHRTGPVTVVGTAPRRVPKSRVAKQPRPLFFIEGAPCRRGLCLIRAQTPATVATAASRGCAVETRTTGAAMRVQPLAATP
jgi:hypothetical protein